MSGEARVIVATNAFGMGIDKADVRTVCHATVPGLARGLLPGGRPGRAGRRAGALPAVRRAARQGPARVLHPALAARRRRVRAGRRAAAVGRAGRSLRRRRRLSWPPRSGRVAMPRRPSGRSSGIWPAPGWWRRSPLRRTAPRGWSSASGTGARWRVPRLRPRRRARALEPVPLGVGLRRGVELPARRRCSRTSATGRARRRRWRAATCARRRWRRIPGRSPSGVRDRAAPERPTRAATSTPRSSTWSCSAAPPVGRTRAVEILRGGRSKVIAQYAYDRLAAYGAFAHLRSTEVLGRVDQLLEDGHAPLHRRQVSRSSARHERRGPGLRRRHEPPGAARSGSRTRRRRDRGRRLRQAGRARRSSARVTRASPSRAFPGSAYRGAGRARPRDGGLAGRPRGRARGARRLHAAARPTSSWRGSRSG